MPRVRGPGNTVTQGLPEVSLDPMGGVMPEGAAGPSKPDPSGGVGVDESLIPGSISGGGNDLSARQMTDVINSVVPAIKVILR